MTSNLGIECIGELCAGDQRPDMQMLQEAIHPLLRDYFKPALLARMRVVPYYPIKGGFCMTLQGLNWNAWDNGCIYASWLSAIHPSWSHT